MSTEASNTVRDLAGHVKEGTNAAIGDNFTRAESMAGEVAASVQKRAGEMADDAIEAAEGVASRAGAAFRGAAAVVGEQAQNVGGKIHDTGARAHEVVGDTVAKAPLLSLLGMAAIGYLAAFLIHSRSSPLADKPLPERWVRRW